MWKLCHLSHTPMHLMLQVFMLKRATEEPLGRAASIVTDVLENAESSGVITTAQKRALLQEMALRLSWSRPAHCSAIQCILKIKIKRNIFLIVLRGRCVIEVIEAIEHESQAYVCFFVIVCRKCWLRSVNVFWSFHVIW